MLGPDLAVKLRFVVLSQFSDSERLILGDHDRWNNLRNLNREPVRPGERVRKPRISLDVSGTTPRQTTATTLLSLWLVPSSSDWLSGSPLDPIDQLFVFRTLFGIQDRRMDLSK